MGSYFCVILCHQSRTSETIKALPHLNNIMLFSYPLYITGLSQLDAAACGRMGSRALAYYSVTTIVAVIIGICCVLTIHPGNPAIKGELGEGYESRKVTTLDAFLDLIRFEIRQHNMHDVCNCNMWDSCLMMSHDCRMNVKWMSNECRKNVARVSNECRMNAAWNVAWMSQSSNMNAVRLSFL